MLKRFLAICLLLLSVSSSATAGDYLITEQQLTRLEVNLKTLKQINQQLQKELETLHQQSKTQEELLTKASISFEEYAASQQTKLRRTKAERNALLVLLSGAAVALIVKK